MKALIISYYFPPYGGGATVRIHSFVKYLPKEGIIPIILTAKSEYYDSTYLDNQLLTEYWADVTIYRSKVLFGGTLKKAKEEALVGAEESFSLKRSVKKAIKNLLIPDEHIFWLMGSLGSIKDIMRQHKIDVIISTGPPFSAHLLAALIARKYNILTILDYRDLWSDNEFYSKGKLSNKLHSLLEKFTINSAKHVICTNLAAKKAMITKFELEHSNISVIENGYDGEVLFDALHNANKPLSDKIIRINYIGSLTRKRTPKYFLLAVKKFTQLYSTKTIEIGFIGYTADSHIKLVHDMNLESVVKFYGSVPRKQALEIMCNSEVLVILQRKSEGGRTAIPGKLYEYLAIGKPIITMDEGFGASSQFLQSLKLPFISEYDDVDAILGNIVKIYFNYKDIHSQFLSQKNIVKTYERSEQAKKLAYIVTKKIHED
ncbi:glycosyl transferase group 1 [Candidatus Thiomargarita nelsonii]|uniref:Glycosyl transferase group 1 n=1 Tax=Candidatus Thiomargarita nelsonii TaxID=1003181 RepID=A0A176RZY4_9GAMM|nr:glycosyl transferase group 1 [Candidatus Thiomargarita nelsonii]